MTLLDCPTAEEVSEQSGLARRKLRLSQNTPYFTTSQKTAMDRLNALAEVFSRVGDAKPGGFRALLQPLIIGPTGSGKTTLVHEFARRRGWSFLSVDAGSWIILGAYTKPPTLQVIRDHVRSAPKTCILVDEICKMLPTHEDAGKGWYQGVFSEYLSFADSDERLIGHGWTQEDIQKFRRSCFVCAGGAFTSALQAARLSAQRGELGFRCGSGGPQTHASKVAEALPPELFTRFHSEVIILAPPTRQDYALGIERIQRSLGRQDNRPLEELLDCAESSGKGVRWITDYLTSLLVDEPGLLPEADEPQEEAAPVPKPKEFDFFTQEAMHYIKQTTVYSFRLHATLGQLYGQISLHRRAINRRRNKTFAAFLLKCDQGGFEQMLHVGINYSYGCFHATADDSGQVDSLLRLHQVTWEAMSRYAPELQRYGLLQLVVRVWDLSNRVAEMRATLSDRVASGRFTRQDS